MGGRAFGLILRPFRAEFKGGGFLDRLFGLCGFSFEVLCFSLHKP